jgi:hypothetical protein
VAVARRIGAGAGLLLIVGAGIVVIGGTLAALLILNVDDTPASEEAAAEAADVAVLRCGQNLQKMTVRLRVTNHSSVSSDYFIDVAFVQRASGTILETAPAVVEDLAPGASRPVALESTADAPRRFDCQVGDVDRLSA